MTFRPAKSRSETSRLSASRRVKAGASSPGSSTRTLLSRAYRCPLKEPGCHRHALSQALLAADDDALARVDAALHFDEAGRADAQLHLAAARLGAGRHPDVVRALERDDRILRNYHGSRPHRRGQPSLDEHAGLQL